MYEYSARLARRSKGLPPVYDGDTVWLDIDLGLGSWRHQEDCRLYGINAPEIRGETHDAGLRSRDWLRGQLAGMPTFRIKTYRDEKGKFGRWLVEIFAADGTNLNQKMVELGLAEKDFYGNPETW